MKKLVSLTLASLLLGSTLFASDNIKPEKKEKPDFKTIKQHVLSEQSKLINLLQENHSCVENSKNMEDLQICRKNFRKQSKHLRKNNKKRVKEFKKEKIQKLEQNS